jgi:hypothetical protein
MSNHPRHFRIALIALLAAVSTSMSTGRAAASSTRSGATSCARKCCQDAAFDSCCCPPHRAVNEAPRRAPSLADQIRPGTADRTVTTCGCSAEPPASPADQESSTNVKTFRVDARLVSTVVEHIDPIDGSSRDTDRVDAVPFKTPLFLRLAHLLI